MAKTELLARTQNRHVLEMSALRTEQIDELRNEAREKGVLVQDPQELNPKLEWEIKPSGRGYKQAVGQTPERKGIPTFAYYCEHCGGWIESQPDPEEYNSISDLHPLSGWAGSKYNCKVCDLQVGRSVDMVS